MKLALFFPPSFGMEFTQEFKIEIVFYWSHIGAWTHGSMTLMKTHLLIDFPEFRCHFSNFFVRNK